MAAFKAWVISGKLKEPLAIFEALDLGRRAETTGLAACRVNMTRSQRMSRPSFEAKAPRAYTPFACSGRPHLWLDDSPLSEIMSNFSLFNERKAAQAAACLLHKAGGVLPLLKLMKLLYLSERLSMQRYGDTITGDSFVSMPHGPVLSMTLDHMNGALPSQAGGWDTWIADRADNSVALRDESMIRTPEEDLLALSETDLECLTNVWTEFGHWDKFKLRDYTHSSACPEWEDPRGSSRPIPTARLLKAVGYGPDQIEALSSRLHEQRYITSALS